MEILVFTIAFYLCLIFIVFSDYLFEIRFEKEIQGYIIKYKKE